jgi:SAM-dependent methyltransferase
MNRQPTSSATPPAAPWRRLGCLFVASTAVILGLGMMLTCDWFAGIAGHELNHRWPIIAAGIAAVCALTLGNLFIRWLRWHLILRRLGMLLPARDSALLYVATLPAILTPLRLGELIRPVILGKRYPRFRLDAGAVWLLERTSDLLVLAIFSGLTGNHSLVGFATVAWLVAIAAIRAVYRRRRHTQVMRPSALFAILLASFITWLLPALALVTVMTLLGAPIGIGLGLQAFARSTVSGNLTGLPGGILLTGTHLIAHLQSGRVALDAAIVGVFLFRMGTTWFSVVLGVLTGVAGQRRLRAMLAPERGQTHFDQLAQDYAHELPEHIKMRLVTRKTDCMVHRLALPATGSQQRGLDFGCGHAWYCAHMAKLGYRMVGVDISPEQIDQARRYLTQYHVDADCLTIAPGKLPFPDNHFDFAYSINVFHHILDEASREQSWRELVRVLKPGGSFFLHEINVTNPLFRFYAGYIYPLIRAIDEGTERWIEPDRLPPVAGGEWQSDITYFTFLPDFTPGWMLDRLTPLESCLERSRWRTWSAHYMACLKKSESEHA